MRGIVHPDAVSAVKPRIKATTILLLRRDMVLPRSSEDYLLIECRSVCPRHTYNTAPKTLITSVFAKSLQTFFRFSFCRYASGPGSGVPVCCRERYWGTATLDRAHIKISWRARGMRIGSDRKPDTFDALGARLVFATAESRAPDTVSHYIA